MNRAYEGLCNIINCHRRKDDVVPIEALLVLKRDCDIEMAKEAAKGKSKLKVYYCNYDGDTYRLVAAKSRKQAAELMKIPPARFKAWGNETHAPLFIQTALAEPGKVFKGSL